MVPVSKQSLVELPVFMDKFVDRNRFKYLGSGYFGYVFEHLPTGYVVKITGFNIGGVDTYPLFAKMCMSNVHLKHLPKIHHLQEYSNAYFVITEKYVVDLITSNSYRHKMKGVIEGTENRHGILEDSMFKTCRAISALNGYTEIDLNNDNLMRNAAGEIVITDPFSFVRKQD